MKELKLTEIWIYPIKGLGGIRLKSSKVLGKGLPLDRRWMLVDERGVGLTQRDHSKMALFKLSLGSEALTVEYNGEQISISDNANGMSEPEQVMVWDDTVTAHEVSTHHSAWFTKHLASTCRLMYFPESNPRPVDPTYKVNDEHVSLADAYPFLIVGQSSLDDLNNRLSQPVPMNRFRPNFVYSGGDPFEEDTWRNFTIGDAEFVAVKPCARCLVITINQGTAEKGVEPLKTLSSYRGRNNKVYFGQNLVSLTQQEIKEGDIIQVKSYR
jgi:uncharacterized protein